MSYIVTATSGHLGHLIVESLLARGAAPESIVATARNVDKLSALAALGVRTAVLDYGNPETVTAVVEPGDVLMLVSGSEVGQRVPQHTAVIAAAQAAGVGRIVYTSAPKATASALLLAPEHKATEEFLIASGVPFSILRNGWYTENYTGEIERARQAGEIVASVGDGRVASASRADYADAAAAAILDDSLAGKTLELSGDHAWDFDELAATIGTLIDSSVAFRNLTPAAHAELLASFGLDEGTVGFVVGLDANIRDGLLGETSGDLARLIGRPTTPLAEGLAASV
ncbi:NAD(P)H-binding protein [Cryobacterium sp. 10I1]|uniref:NAD(P)H-binding protein n=1 Tax=unclassified Cryobacterium TaxID=2649013 RepID=UPI002AC94A42|nr:MULTISPECIES: NAD(P)H-binding protein [unclassified Cryobacterium]MEB0287606.1 NAD(P)H-binding protein [Cryobacterium sp. 10S3]MEB0304659.1 NAD(P)H-binding protein [Cryobacterium sp. 10I1]WPX13240.1 NAD(P)H-binding protein [Cryobacterium sp. 10S3]